MAAAETQTPERIAEIPHGDEVPSRRGADGTRAVLCAADSDRRIRVARDMDNGGGAVCGTAADADVDTGPVRMAHGIVDVRIAGAVVRYLPAVGIAVSARHAAVATETAVVGTPIPLIGLWDSIKSH